MIILYTYHIDMAEPQKLQIKILPVTRCSSVDAEQPLFSTKISILGRLNDRLKGQGPRSSGYNARCGVSCDEAQKGASGVLVGGAHRINFSRKVGCDARVPAS